MSPSWLRRLVKALSRFTTSRAQRPSASAKKKWTARNLAVELLETRIVPSVSTPTLVGYTQATDSGVLGDRVTNALHQTVEGTATAGNDITVFEIVGTTRTQLGTTTADTDGKWTFDLDRTESAFKLQVKASDGTSSKFSTAREFVVDTSAPVVDTAIDDVSTTEDGADSVVDVGGTFIDASLGNDNDTLTLSIASNDNSGLLTASIENGTDLRLHLLANQNGMATITVQAMDAAGNVQTDEFQVAVAAVNDAPVIAAPGGQSVDEDNALIFSQDNSNAITVSDVDVAETPGGQLEVSLSVGSGTLTLSGTAGLDFSFAGAQGSGVGDATMTFRGTAADINAALEGLTYAPGPDFNGSDTLAITTNDLGNTGAGGPLSDTKSVAITVNAVNDAPVAKADSNSTHEDTPVSGNVLTNDTDVEGDALVVTNTGTFTTGTGATVVLNADGTYSYDPTTSASLNMLAVGETATDSFSYSISDGNGGISSATVTITVSGVNDAPVPSPDPSPGLTPGERSSSPSSITPGRSNWLTASSCITTPILWGCRWRSITSTAAGASKRSWRSSSPPPSITRPREAGITPSFPMRFLVIRSGGRLMPPPNRWRCRS